MHTEIVGSTGSIKGRLFAMLNELALIKGPVKLACGDVSEFYFDCRQVYLRGEAQFLLGELFFQKLLAIENTEQQFLACGGMATGAIPLSCALSSAAFRRGRELPGVYVRASAKEHGTKAQIEGARCLTSGAQLLLLEDVVSTGGSAIAAANVIREHGAVANILFCIVDREQGADLALAQAGITLHSLFKASEFTK